MDIDLKELVKKVEKEQQRRKEVIQMVVQQLSSAFQPVLKAILSIFEAFKNNLEKISTARNEIQKKKTKEKYYKKIICISNDSGRQIIQDQVLDRKPKNLVRKVCK